MHTRMRTDRINGSLGKYCCKLVNTSPCTNPPNASNVIHGMATATLAVHAAGLTSTYSLNARSPKMPQMRYREKHMHTLVWDTFIIRCIDRCFSSV